MPGNSNAKNVIKDIKIVYEHSYFFGNHLNGSGSVDVKPRLNFSVTRNAMNMLAIAHMLQDKTHNYTIEDILDPSKLKEERQKAGDEVFEMYNKLDDKALSETCAKYITETLSTLMKQIGDKFKEMPEINGKELCKPENSYILKAVTYLQDLGQELGNVKEAANEIYGKEFIDDLLDKQVGGATFLLGIKDSYLEAVRMQQGEIGISSQEELINNEDAVDRLIVPAMMNVMGGVVAQKMVNDEKNKAKDSFDFFDTFRQSKGKGDTLIMAQNTLPMSSSIREPIENYLQGDDYIEKMKALGSAMERGDILNADSLDISTVKDPQMGYEMVNVEIKGLGDFLEEYGKNYKEVESFHDIKQGIDIWDEIINDYNLPEDIAQIADYIRDSRLDIRNQAQIDLIKIKNSETGELESLDFSAPKELSKLSAVTFLHQIAGKLKNEGDTVYDFNGLVSVSDAKNPKAITKQGNSLRLITAKDIDMSESPEEPEPVAKPNIFKRLTNRMFGWFKNDISTYNQKLQQYNVKKAKYDKDMKVRESIENLKKEDKKYREMSKKMRAKVKTADKLQQRVAEEKAKDSFINVAAGRSNALLERGTNYKVLSQITLKEHPELPMAGLALLVGNSRKANDGVLDGSTPLAESFPTKQTLNPEEKKLLDGVVLYAKEENIGAKVMDSFYGGERSNAKRMEGRTQAIIDSRMALNEAAAEYLRGDKQPLADLMNDSLDVVYATIIDKSRSGMSTPSSKAVTEIYKACDEMFKKDPEFRKMIHMSDEKLKVIKAAAKLYEVVQGMEQKQYENYKQDKGPDTPERQKAVEEMLFEHALCVMIPATIAQSRQKANSEAKKIMEGDFYKDFINKFEADPGLSEPRMLEGHLEGKLTLDNWKPPKQLMQFASDKFDLNRLKEDTLKMLRETPIYKDMMKMDKEKLFSMNATDIQTDITKEISNIEKKKVMEASKIKDATKDKKNEKTNEKTKTQGNVMGGGGF